MRVGIITIHNSRNYGACLQSFALYKYLSDSVDECEVIDLWRPAANEGYRHNNRYMPYRSDYCSFRNRSIRSIKKLLGKKKVRVRSIKSAEKFTEFNSQIKLSKPYKGIKELYNNPPKYDIYITGSDQVWNPTQPYCLEPYFLTFAPSKSIKLSYAPSIAVPTLTSEEKADYKMWLSKYDDVSVREYDAKILLESFTDIKITQVADPTFLLDVDYWLDIATNPHIDEPYILVFPLTFSQEMYDYAVALSKETKLKLVVFKRPDANIDCMVDDDGGPKEFLGYIKNAKLVITDSFHCTLFSILLGCENFYAYIKSTNNRGSRITNLLDTFSLQSHLLDISVMKTSSDVDNDIIDRESVLSIIKEEQQKSRAFLDKWINK